MLDVAEDYRSSLGLKLFSFANCLFKVRDIREKIPMTIPVSNEQESKALGQWWRLPKTTVYLCRHQHSAPLKGVFRGPYGAQSASETGTPASSSLVSVQNFWWLYYSSRTILLPPYGGPLEPLCSFTLR
jgi:hypothetical protein